MALTNEDLMAIATLLQPINERLDKVDSRLDNLDARLDKVDERLDNLDSRLDNLERQIKRTERTLKAEIINSENLILDEVSRVHRILNEHAKDKTKHIA